MEKTPKSGDKLPETPETSIEPVQQKTALEKPQDGKEQKREREEEKSLQIEQLQKKIKESSENRPETFLERIRLRESRPSRPVEITTEERELISEISSSTQESITKNYEPGFGIFPSADPRENFYGQIWARDFAHATGNYFAKANPEAVKDSLGTMFRNQRADGAMPYKVENRYAMVQMLPKVGPYLAKRLFDLIEGGLRGRKERPLYEGQEFSGAEDTIPALAIAAGEFFINSEMGRQFTAEHFDQLKKAMDFFRKKTDPKDGLADIRRPNPDWEDSLYRKGKLGNINIWWARSLRLMEFMANQMRREEDARAYKEEYRKVQESVMDKLYNKEEGYFRAKEGEDRLDTTASIFGALYLLSPQEAVRVEESLKKRVKHSSGLKNFDPPYPKSEIFWIHRMVGHQGYHNEFVWPWVTCQNIQVKIKIALQHPDETIRAQYKQEAVKDLIGMAELFKKAGGAYEIFNPDEPTPARTAFYTPPKNLMGNLVAYQGAHDQLHMLGWI